MLSWTSLDLLPGEAFEPPNLLSRHLRKVKTPQRMISMPHHASNRAERGILAFWWNGVEKDSL